jgi:diadenosine tetraphosphate (Ap4A) HIT family hydrolase
MAECSTCELLERQFAEARDHRHVHVHVIPRSPDLEDERRGPGIFACLGVPESERVSEDDDPSVRDESTLRKQ